MKKICCLCLAALITALCCIIPASAADAEISPALQQVMNEKDENETADILLWFSDETLSIDRMPSWPGYEASREYAEYLRDLNRAILAEIFEGVENSFVNYALKGCAVAYDVAIKDIGKVAESPHVREVDLYDASGYDGGWFHKDNKLSPQLGAVMKYADPDEYLTVCVGNVHHLKTLAEMPSYPTQKTDRDTFNAMREKASEEYREYIAGVEEEFFTVFDGIDTVFHVTGFGFMTIVSVKARDVERLEQSGLVRYLEFVENAFEEVPGDDPPLDNPPLRGDADMDGEVTVIDASYIQRLKAGVIGEEKIDPICADVDEDGLVSVMDATRIQKALASLCTLDGAPLS